MHFSPTFCAFSHSLSESSSMMRLFAAATDRRPSMVLCTDGHTCARSCTPRDSEIRIYLCMRLHPFMQALTIMGKSISPPPKKFAPHYGNIQNHAKIFHTRTCTPPTWGSSVPPTSTRQRGRARGRSRSLPSCTALPHTHPRTVKVSMIRLRSASFSGVPP